MEVSRDYRPPRLWAAAAVMLLALAGVGMSGCSDRVAGGETSGTETGNARVRGVVRDSLGNAVAGVRVIAYPPGFDPAIDEQPAARSVTNALGEYELRPVDTNVLNVVGVEPGGGSRFLIRDVRPVKGKGPPAPRVDTLRKPGSGMVPLPPGFAGSTRHLYVTGTPFLIHGKSLTPGDAFARFDSLPAGTQPAILVREGASAPTPWVAADSLAITPDMLRAAARLPAPWRGTSIGEALRGGGAGADSTFYLTGGGEDIWGPRDGCYFVNQDLEGDFTLTARLTALDRTDLWSKAALMIRASLDPQSPMLALSFLMGPDQDPAIDVAVLIARPASGDTARGLPGAPEFSGPPAWLRLQRVGKIVTASASTDGLTWQPVSADSATALPPKVFVGLAHTSENPDVLGKAAFESVSLSVPNP